MSKTETRRRLRDALAKLEELGHDEEIRDYMYDNGLRGNRRDPGKCVIADYLKREAGFEAVTVTPSMSKVFCGFARVDDEELTLEDRVRVRLPRVVNRFGRRFDAGEFKELVKQ